MNCEAIATYNAWLKTKNSPQTERTQIVFVDHDGNSAGVWMRPIPAGGDHVSSEFYKLVVAGKTPGRV